MIVLAALPLICTLCLILALGWSALKALAVSAVVAFVLSMFIWGTPLTTLAASVISSLVSSLDIFIIIFGALALYEVLVARGMVIKIVKSLEQIATNKILKILILSWLFVGFFEGAAGFGTPAAIVAPLLVLFGVKPINAVIMCLLGDSAAVTFGAVGTPIYGGFQAISSFVGQEALGSKLNIISIESIKLNIALLSFMPLIIAYLAAKDFGEKMTLQLVGLSLFLGFTFTLFQLIIASIMGGELASILAALLSLVALALLLKSLGLSSFSFRRENLLTLYQAWQPYILILFLLLLTRVGFLPFKQLLKMFQVNLYNLFNTGIHVNWLPLYNPGVFPFLLLAVLYGRDGEFRSSLTLTLRKLLPAFPVIFLGVFMVALMNNSGGPETLSMITMLAQFAAKFGAEFWYIVAPFLGALGAFVSGSATVSNIFFGSFQYSTSELGQLSPTLTLALQAFGSSIGNMICLHNIVAALAVVGFTGKEYKVLKINLPICLGVCLFAGLGVWTLYSY